MTSKVKRWSINCKSNKHFSWFRKLICIVYTVLQYINNNATDIKTLGSHSFRCMQFNIFLRSFFTFLSSEKSGRLFISPAQHLQTPQLTNNNENCLIFFFSQRLLVVFFNKPGTPKVWKKSAVRLPVGVKPNKEYHFLFRSHGRGREPEFLCYKLILINYCMSLCSLSTIQKHAQTFIP